MSFFATLNEDGAYDLTAAGYAVLVIVMVALIILASALQKNRRRMSTKQLAFSAIAMALAVVTSFIKVIHMPMGGAVTLWSMLFIVLVGYWYGLSAGITTAVAYGILQLIQDPYIISLPQLLTDYILAFGSLGISGLFCGKKILFVNEKKNSTHTISGLVPGYILAVLLRLFFSTLSGVIFFGIYAPDNFPNPLIYSLVYNGSYIGLEAVMTLILISLPPVVSALEKVKRLATTDQAENTRKPDKS
ncbi:MAG: energy-coupled thiamine transporter ThiT [Lachnospiraceae bacterium]|nr:energy-coupled thiamine transporter ThiT [Lachnospiraceae bacterium]